MNDKEGKSRISNFIGYFWGREKTYHGRVLEPYDDSLLVETVKNGNHVTRRNYDGTVSNNWLWSNNINRFKAPERPYYNDPELWTGHDVYEYYRKNNGLIHCIGIFMGSMCLILADMIETRLRWQADFYHNYSYHESDREFQHLPELKLAYLGIREKTVDIGWSPGWWPGIMMLATNVVGIVEVKFARRGYSWFGLNRILWSLAVATILLGIPLYLNNISAVHHNGFVDYGWFGLGPLRNRTGYCHMSNNTYTNRIQVRYVLPPQYRSCRGLTTIHNIQVMFSVYCTIVAYTIIKMVRVPAWGGWNKEKLVAHGLGKWLYVGP